MGFYLSTPGFFNKANVLAKMYDGRIIDQIEAYELVRDGVGAVVCVVRNPEFEAAAFCHSMKEFTRFSSPDDPRVKTWLALPDRDVVETVSGYKQAQLAEAADANEFC